MALTAREWLLLPEKEQKKRGDELSPYECSRLRMDLAHIHFSEEEKQIMSEEEKQAFLNPPKLSEEEREKRRKDIESILKEWGLEFEE